MAIRPSYIIAIWKELDYYWFRFGNKLRGPYHTKGLAEQALKEYKKRKPKRDTEKEWRKVL